jgi:hypothetical protein
VNAIIHGTWDRLSGADKQYTKYKWLLNSKCHQSIESLLKECYELHSRFALNTLLPEKQDEVKQQIVELHDKTTKLEKTYDEARLAAIEAFYASLKKDIGI